MSASNVKQSVRNNGTKLPITRLAVVIALAGFSLTVQAGKITSIPSTTVPGVQDSFGGLNFDNIEVIFNGTGSSFDELTGAYVFGSDSDFSYAAHVYDDESQTTLMGYVLAKDWPVGEPAGVKIVNDDFDVKQGKPTNCIMSTSYLDGHFLDEAVPQQVLCSGPFQSHKRYKQAMLPSMVAGGIGNEKSIDLVFNVEAEAGSRDYQVFQKINNWTDGRLEGFTIEVGFGTGTSFTPASAVPGVDVTNLSLSVPAEIWSSSQLANFSTGLFGPIDTQHDRPAGFFDPNKRAGFSITEYPINSGLTDKLTSGATLGSAYADVPVGAGAASNQFGNWLPNNMLPYGIFFDDDGNPDTDAELVAWYGYNPTITDFGWMAGVADSFAAVPDINVTTWGGNLLYSMGVIDDLVNVGLNYVVTVGDVSAFPNAAFTIHITPKIDTSAMAAPGYVGQVPVPTLKFIPTDAIITLDPSPEFVSGSLLTARVGDADLNLDSGAIDTTTVDVTTNDGSVAPFTLTLEELGIDRGVFAASLPDDFSNVAAGTIVTITYNDLLGGAVEPELITATSTAAGSLATRSDGGGWCSYNPNGRFDPILPGIVLAALAYFGWRLKKRAQ